MYKLMYKVRRLGWKHFCYIPEELVTEDRDYNKLIEKWARKDFGINIISWDDLKRLKKAIVQHYKDKYPEIYIKEADYDAGGWVRNWVLDHLKEEK